MLGTGDEAGPAGLEIDNAASSGLRESRVKCSMPHDRIQKEPAMSALRTGARRRLSAIVALAALVAIVAYGGASVYAFNTYYGSQRIDHSWCATPASWPIAIVHGTADTTAPIKHADLLIAADRANGGTVDPWILPGVAHVRAAFVATAEYESRLTTFFSGALGAPGAQR